MSNEQYDEVNIIDLDIDNNIEDTDIPCNASLTKIEDLDLPNVIKNLLPKYSIYTLEDLLNIDYKDFRYIRTLGAKKTKNIKRLCT